MSVKNNRRKHRKDNGYPLPERTVIFSRKKNMQPVPEVGKKYHCFDDGKISFSRHYIIEVTEVLRHNAFKRKYPELFEDYLKATKECYWLYSRHTDWFVIANACENNELCLFVRMKNGGWFEISGWFDSGELDVTGELWENLVKNINDFNYTQEEKERIIKENTIC